MPLTGLTIAQAVDRIKAAFAAEGLAIASADAGVVVSRPVRVRSTLSTQIEKRYIATVVAQERDPRVVVTGGSRLFGDERRSPVGSQEPSWPAREGHHGFLKVRRIAARLERPRPHEQTRNPAPHR